VLAFLVAASALAGPRVASAGCSTSSPCVSNPLEITAPWSLTIGNGVSADGSVVVGFHADTSVTQAFRWTAAGGLLDLGLLSGGTFSYAAGVSADGTVVVGQADNAFGDLRAFRWTSTGGMFDLGTLGGWESTANAVSADGSVVVGDADTSGGEVHAFRWTSTGGMQDLGTLGGVYSTALGVSGNGLVVVGTSDTGLAYHAFRWAASSGMIDLGTLGGPESAALGANHDGSVVVGYADTPTGSNAFRWTAATGMQDLGNLGGMSKANAVSADGRVVVGDATVGCGCGTVAFRWTAATGMQDLNVLLANTGVNMTGILLANAQSISPDGQFIVGTGEFGPNISAYVVRYFDGIIGLTTYQSVEASMQQLADARFGTMAQHNGFAMPLLGGDKPMGLGNEVGVFTSFGSFSAGGHARYAFGNGFTVLGGVAYAREELDQVDIRDSVIAAAALQYVHPAAFVLGGRPFVEAGGWIAPDASIMLARTYDNGAGLALGVGNAHADISYYYGRAGLLYAWSPADQVAVSTELGRARMEAGAYSEPLTAANPFEAHVSEGTDTMSLAKLRAQWSHRFTASIDATVWAAAVHDLHRSSDVSVLVAGFGTLSSQSGESDSTWAEYGVRVGYALSSTATVDVFANGVSGPGAIDTRIHTGAALRVRY
jgi:probable HAF family extracellular repeat protein